MRIKGYRPFAFFSVGRPRIRHEVSVLKNGYQSLWKKMVERHSTEVNYITGAKVTGVKRTPTVEVKYMHAGSAPLAESCLGHMLRYHDKRRGLYYIIFVKAL